MQTCRVQFSDGMIRTMLLSFVKAKLPQSTFNIWLSTGKISINKKS